MDDLRYTSDSFRFHMQIINTNVKVELPQTFQTYVHLFVLFVHQHDISQLAAVSLVSGIHSERNCGIPIYLEDTCADWFILSHCALDLRAFPISSTNAERAFSMFSVVNKNEHASVMDSNIAKYTYIHYNKLSA